MRSTLELTNLSDQVVYSTHIFCMNEPRRPTSLCVLRTFKKPTQNFLFCVSSTLNGQWSGGAAVAICGQNEHAVIVRVLNLVNSRAKVLTGCS